jgi:diguanylate cyclase (GGDEF)-like protein/PAS domain S-box-containing protein
MEKIKNPFEKGNLFRVLLGVVLFLIFSGITYLLYPHYGSISWIILTIPIIIVSWVSGWGAGLFWSLCGILVNGYIRAKFDFFEPIDLLLSGIFMVGVGILIGKMRQFTEREHQLTKELRDKNKLLSRFLSEKEEFSSALEEQTTQLSQILESINTMSSTLDTEDVVRNIAVEIATSLDASGCTVSNWDRDSDLVVTLVDYRRDDPDPAEGPGSSYLLTEYPTTKKVMEKGEFSIVYRDDPLADPSEIRFMEKQNIISLLLLPIKYDGEVIGLVEVDDIRERKFSEEDLNTSLKLVEHAGVAIHNAVVYEEIQNRLKVQTILAEAANTIASSLDMNETLNLLCGQFCNALEATSAYVSTFDIDTSYSTVIAEYFSQEASEIEIESDLGKSYLEENDKFLEFMSSGMPYINQIDNQDTGNFALGHISKFGGKTVLYLPLRMKNNPKGYIEVWESRKNRNFTEAEIHLGMLLADQAVIALENAFLHNQVAEAELRFRSIAENSPDQIILLDKDLVIRYVNHSFPGLTDEHLMGTSLYTYVEEDQQDEIKQILKGIFETGQPGIYETRYLDPDGEPFYYESRVSPLSLKGEISGLVVNSRNISQRKAMEGKLKHMAMHDPLTGLPNRRLLEQHLNQLLKLVSRQELTLVVVILDLDDFKAINDTYGHGVGDQVLAELGKRLKENFRESDFAARFGGDEFIVLILDRKQTPSDRFHERFEAIFSEPVSVGDFEIDVDASFGSYAYDGQIEVDADTIIKHADDAMYREKSRKKQSMF